MLRQTGSGWQFENEARLEDFLQRQLKALLGLRLLAQQHTINGQVCDLIAVSDTGQLVILELKNQEDRYITQQLTRYFDAILKVKPFETVADYTQPIRLLAIAPGFHRDNFIDRKYSQLKIEFLMFHVVQSHQTFALALKHLDTGECIKASIFYQPPVSSISLPKPPQTLLSKLAKGPIDDRDGVMALRQQLLSFDDRIKEISSTSSILYGSGKSSACAELRYDSKRKRIVLFLWLPHVVTGFKQRHIVARLRLWTDWLTVSDLAHVPKGTGRVISVDEWLAGDLRPLNKLMPKGSWNKERYKKDSSWKVRYINAHRHSRHVTHYTSGVAMSFERYREVIEQPVLSGQLQEITQLALKTWLERRG